MKYLLSTTLLVAGIVAFGSTSAMAYDLDHPFYGPSKGKLVSTTSYDFTKESLKAKSYGDKGHLYEHSVSEMLAYGLTDNWTVYGGLDKQWEKTKVDGSETGAYHGKMASYTLGTSYNVINDGRAFAQLGAYYHQSFEEGGHVKTGKVNAKVGYDLGSFTPLAYLTLTRPLNEGHDNHTTYDLFLGAYKKLTKQTSGLLGVNLEKAKNSTKEQSATLMGEYNYLLQRNLNLKLTASYLLKEKTTSDVARATKGYSLGATVQYEF